MQLHTVPARQGAIWVRQGLKAFFRQPLGFAALIATFMFIVLLLALLPLVGQLLVLVALPLTSLSFMLATQVTLQGGFPTPLLFITPLRGGGPRVRALVKLGLSYAAATFLVMWISDLVDAGVLETTMASLPAAAQAGGEAVAAKLATPGLMSGLALRLGLAGLLSVPFWHAPALIHWGGQGCAQSLFSSTIACWRNRGAFTVYSLTWFALLLGVCLLLALTGSPAVITVGSMAMSLVFPTVFYASLYFTFADCFGFEPPAAEVVAA